MHGSMGSIEYATSRTDFVEDVVLAKSLILHNIFLNDINDLACFLLHCLD